MAKLTPRLPNESDPIPTDNDICLGDIHSDAIGLENLLKKANYNPDTQKVYFVGDLIDRGPAAKRVLELKSYYGWISVLGNHDWKIARYVYHELNRVKTGKENPIKPNPEMQDTINQLGDDLIKYGLEMKEYPLYLPFEDSQGNGVILHGGVNPTQPMSKQDPNMILVRRQFPHPPEFMRGESPEYPAWQRTYNGYLGTEGPLTLIHGHQGTSSHDYFQNPYVISLDGSGSIGKYAMEKDDIPGWNGMHRLVRLGDRKIFESPGSEESENHYKKLIDAEAYANMQGYKHKTAL